MKAQELRIGNCVKNDSVNSSDGLPDNAFKITGNGIHRFSDGILHFEAVPLSILWLKWCGLNENHIYENIYEYSNELVRIQTDCLETFIVMGYHDGIEITHVHQLQNLYYALTGQEIEFVSPS